MARRVKIAKKDVPLTLAQPKGLRGLVLVKEQYIAVRRDVDNTGITDFGQITHVHTARERKKGHSVEFLVYRVHHARVVTAINPMLAKKGALLLG